MEVEERLPRFVLDEIFKAKEEDKKWSSLKLKEKLHNILKRKSQIETLISNHNSSPIPNSQPTSPLFSKPPHISKPPNNIPTLTFNTQNEEFNPTINNTQTNLSCINSNENNSHILLKCVKVKIFNPKIPSIEREVILLLDDASKHSYINTNLAKSINLNLKPNSIKLGVFNSPCKIVPTFNTQFGIRLSNGHSLTIHANTLEHLTQATNYVPFSPEIFSKPEITSNAQIVYPTILLGSDYYYEVEPKPLIRLPSGHHLIHSFLGPIVAGKGLAHQSKPTHRLTNFSNQSINEQSPNKYVSLKQELLNPKPNLIFHKKNGQNPEKIKIFPRKKHKIKLETKEPTVFNTQGSQGT
uniref:DUF1758 domain-containing protein n=1 Tax=Meloidogyne hapla TaxID=6305 RepID=A0A1I8B4M1_MELHA